jgi:hypothetical protein
VSSTLAKMTIDHGVAAQLDAARSELIFDVPKDDLEFDAGKACILSG